MNHYTKVDHHSKPENNDFWILCFIVNLITNKLCIVVKTLQSRTIIISEALALIERLKAELMTLTNVYHHLQDNNNDSNIKVCGTYAIDTTTIPIFLTSNGGLVIQDILPANSELCNEIAKFFLELINGLDKCNILRDEINMGISDPQPTLPNQIYKLNNGQFAALLKRQNKRISHNDLLIIEEEFNKFKEFVEHDNLLSNLIKDENNFLTFYDSWNIEALKGKFKPLTTFLGGIASPFPTTATVESDFSRLRWEKDDFAKRLTDFSLEGILQAKQFPILMDIIKKS